MSLYNILFGQNPQSALLLAVIGLREVDVERLRDVHVSGNLIEVYTRTGGGNRESCPNLTMRKLPTWRGSVDDDFDETYCTDTFKVPEEWRDDVARLSDVFTHGIRPEFARHLAKTLRREPTEADRAEAERRRERDALRRTAHETANGHTFVPFNDSAMKVALDLAEANGGELRTCWGILPLRIRVLTDFTPYPKARDESMRNLLVRVETRTEWKIDESYWQHCMERFAETHPISMKNIGESVQRYIERAETR